ncbi:MULTISPECIES: hypothetical protein [unclassified Bacillus (in: firmicutes)]|uniref:hypothetical protein n=1 Tax=unclassified Bacillus (in: firmicutes) TaxID=185979 RepID=UPI0030ED8B26
MKFGEALELLNDGHNITRSGSRKYVYVVGRTVIDAKKQWRNIRSRYPQYKNPIFISRNPASIDGLTPDRMVLVLLTGYLENPIVKNDFFRYLVENAAEVNYE